MKKAYVSCCLHLRFDPGWVVASQVVAFLERTLLFPEAAIASHLEFLTMSCITSVNHHHALTARQLGLARLQSIIAYMENPTSVKSCSISSAMTKVGTFLMLRVRERISGGINVESRWRTPLKR